MTREQTDDQVARDDEKERLQRWRVLLGKSAEESTAPLEGKMEELDAVLSELYANDGASRRGGLGSSAPRVSRWLGDVRKFFPRSVVQVMQRDAFERFGVSQMLGEPELLETLEVDVHMVSTLLSLSRVIPEKTKQTARLVVRKLVDDVQRRLSTKTISAIKGALARATRTNRPRFGELDFNRTIKLNLKNWDSKKKKIAVERLSGFGRRRNSLYDMVLCVDQSGSMASSVVYSSIFAATLASLPSISTRLVFFDTSVVDMTDAVRDPVDVLFGAQLGGGTDIGQALQYCRSKITRPNKTIFVLISDLYDGGDSEAMLERAREFVRSGVKFICLLALDDEGAACYDKGCAAEFAAMGAPTFACTPDLFPELIAAAINGRDVAAWARESNLSPVDPSGQGAQSGDEDDDLWF